MDGPPKDLEGLLVWLAKYKIQQERLWMGQWAKNEKLLDRIEAYKEELKHG